MIIDTLEHLEQYTSINPLFADVVEFIKKNDLSSLADGKHFIRIRTFLLTLQRQQERAKRMLPTKPTGE